MSSRDLVKCQCCGRMMTPVVTRTRGIFVGWQWGWRHGAGRVNGNVCPFCLSENWDDRNRPVHRSVAQKFALVGLIWLVIGFGYGLFSFLGKDVLGISFGPAFESASQWAFLIIGILMYRRHRKTK